MSHRQRAAGRAVGAVAEEFDLHPEVVEEEESAPRLEAEAVEAVGFGPHLEGAEEVAVGSGPHPAVEEHPGVAQHRALAQAHLARAARTGFADPVIQGLESRYYSLNY